MYREWRRAADKMRPVGRLRLLAGGSDQCATAAGRGGGEVNLNVHKESLESFSWTPESI